MCGIVGYFGKDTKVLDTLVNGLKRLEYRGYDSAGIAIVAKDGQVFSKKAIGKIVELEKELEKSDISKFDKVGIAHTRWATHGSPTLDNCHPHFSQDKKIWLVHNGIIENYKQLKKELESKGVQFSSDTDTEVIAHLVQSFYNGDLKKAVQKTLTKLEGAYAIVVVSADEPGRLVAAKKGSPLVLGVSENEYVLASDVSAIISQTRNVIYFEDGELVDIKDGKYTITNFKDAPLKKKIEVIDWDDEAATKGGHEHFLIKEIMEQAKTMEDSCRGRIVSKSGNVRFGGLNTVKDKIARMERVVILGIGTSYYSAKLAELYFEDIAGIPAKAEMTPEFRYKNPYIDEKTWVIAVSQSGETADSVAAIKEAQNRGALVTGIINTVGSTISRITEAGVYNHIGPEISVASTKAFTSQSIILLMHAVMLGRMRGLSLRRAKAILEEIENMPKLAEETLKQNSNIEKLAEKYHKKNNLIYIGRNYNYPVALEGALKVKEIGYVHAEGLSGGELKHGFIALIDENMPTIAVVPQDSIYEKMISNIEEIKARSGIVIAVATDGDKEVADLCDDVIYTPKMKEEIAPIINTIPLQLFAYHVARLRGLDVDKPRNLAKSVTVE